MSTTHLVLVDVITEVLKTNHPDATAHVDDPGPCDFRICSLDGTLVAVTECGDASLTTEDMLAITMDGLDNPVDYTQDARSTHLFAHQTR